MARLTFILLLGFYVSTTSAQEEIETGKAVFAQHCWFCHGQEGNGISDAAAVLKPKPRDFTSPAAAAELTLERIIYSITTGRPQTAMPSFGETLTAEEIQAVAHYIKDVIMRGGNVDRFYKAHSDGPSYIDFSQITAQTDLRSCLLHCHTDETFIRNRLIILQQQPIQKEKP
jgi:cytochrome c553